MVDPLDPITAVARAGSRLPVVLQVLPALDTGGVERGTLDVAAALVATGWTALVASSGGRMVRELERIGGRHGDLPLDSRNPWTMRANARLLEALIRGHGVDIVHARSRAPAWSALWAARRTGCAFVTTFHGTYNFTVPFKHRYNSVMTRGERVIAISEFIADHIRRHYRIDEARLRVVPRGVDLDVFDPGRVTPERLVQLAGRWRLPDGVPVVMLPGRLARWKGQAILLEALALLGHRQFHCLLVGSAERHPRYRRHLERLIVRRRLESVVHIVDDCHDMPAAYMLADVVVSASTEPEAFGRVIVEAQAMGRPVVATDHGAARETVVPQVTGWLVPPASPRALAEALERTLGLDRPARLTLADEARLRVRERYSKDAMCRRTVEVYRELISDRAGGIATAAAS